MSEEEHEGFRVCGACLAAAHLVKMNTVLLYRPAVLSAATIAPAVSSSAETIALKQRCEPPAGIAGKRARYSGGA